MANAGNGAIIIDEDAVPFVLPHPNDPYPYGQLCFEELSTQKMTQDVRISKTFTAKILKQKAAQYPVQQSPLLKVHETNVTETIFADPTKAMNYKGSANMFF